MAPAARARRSRQSSYPGRVRIIAGRWRGRVIDVLEEPELRPTGNRIRETLFNWLMPVIDGARCLDLFAGSGALGFEAASRGAADVLMIEQDGRKAAHLRAVIAELGAGNVRVREGDAMAILEGPAEKFDIVFLDPPFRQGWIKRSLAALTRKDWLAPGALVYVEIEADADMPELQPGWRLHREKRAGQVRYLLLQADT